MSLISLILALGIAATGKKSIMPQNQTTDQVAPPPTSQDKIPNNDIIITANKVIRYRQIAKFAESITRELDFNNPLARYTSPICLDVSGLKPELNYTIRNNIFNNFEYLKINYKKENCRVNASVFFVDNTNDVMRLIYKKSPMLFGPLEYNDINKKLKEDGKSISIQNIIIRGVDGEKIVGKAVPSRSSSIIDLPIRRDIESSVVLIDRNSVAGYTVEQISGFLSFRILANIKVPSSSSGKSILEMLNVTPSKCPNNMTRWDISYIREVYSGNGNLRGVRKIGQITRRMLQEDK